MGKCFQFKRHFRVNRSTSVKLREAFEASRHFPKTASHGGKPVKSPEVHILSFLWFAGNKTVLRSVAQRFNTSVSTMHTMVERVMNFLLEDVAPLVIKFPATEVEKLESSNSFLNIAGFPGVIGCIDGSYMNIRTPANKIKSTYVNRHDQTSITLQAICNANKVFLDVFTGPPSKIHDSRIYGMSFVKNKVHSLGQNYHLLGDAAYPLSENLLTPYRYYGNLNAVRRSYNYKHSATRVAIENAFGRLKGRFRQLLQTEFWSVEKTSKFIISCCILHNLCILDDDILEDYHDEPHHEDVEAEYDMRQNILRRLGEIKRDQVANRLYNQ